MFETSRVQLLNAIRRMDNLIKLLNSLTYHLTWILSYVVMNVTSFFSTTYKSLIQLQMEDNNLGMLVVVVLYDPICYMNIQEIDQKYL